VKSKRLKTRQVLVIAWLFTCVVFAYIAIKSHYFNKTITVNNVTVQVKIATTSQEKTKGLCCRSSLPENSGMLFVYKNPGDYRFWMKDTKISLDIYWIDAKKTIVHIEHAVQPDSYPQSFGTKLPAQYVLETNAGFAKTHNIKIGDTVAF
jgi:hypothetical protein